uniref:At1g61320/AtMIF1 LRR domain-containing protein n=1 Tax=Leersia perrieri TaxID=77586 RepID=A0A0D9X0Y2_9ORYZ
MVPSTIIHGSVNEGSVCDSFHPRFLSEYRHESLRNVMITGFCSAKSMVELTCHILEKTTSLECLTLDTTRGFDKSHANNDKCLPMNREALLEAENACLAIRRHIEGRVLSTVNLKEPPDTGWAKVYVDGLFCPINDTTGIGVVIRGHHGSVLLFSWHTINHGADAEVENLACREGLALSVEWIRMPCIV